AVDKAGNIATAFALVKLDKTPPNLAVSSPVSGAKIFTSPITVSGTVSDALSGLVGVTCNGITATVNGNGFSCPVTLVPGANSTNIVATDVAGNTSASALSVTYAP